MQYGGPRECWKSFIVAKHITKYVTYFVRHHRDLNGFTIRWMDAFAYGVDKDIVVVQSTLIP